LQSLARRQDLGPRRIEQVIGKSVHAACDGLHAAAATVGQVVKPLRIASEKAEAVEALDRLDCVHGFAQRPRITQHAQGESTARGGVGIVAQRIAKIGDQREATVAPQSEPGSTALQISPVENVGHGPRRRRRRPSMRLVPVGRDHDRVAGMNIEGDER
jgi:hypothetical protein